jgi:hypothetical protein
MKFEPESLGDVNMNIRLFRGIEVDFARVQLIGPGGGKRNPNRPSLSEVTDLASDLSSNVRCKATPGRTAPEGSRVRSVNAPVEKSRPAAGKRNTG